MRLELFRGALVDRVDEVGVDVSLPHGQLDRVRIFHEETSAGFSGLIQSGTMTVLFAANSLIQFPSQLQANGFLSNVKVICWGGDGDMNEFNGRLARLLLLRSMTAFLEIFANAA